MAARSTAAGAPDVPTATVNVGQPPAGTWLADHPARPLPSPDVRGCPRPGAGREPAGARRRRPLLRRVADGRRSLGRGGASRCGPVEVPVAGSLRAGLEAARGGLRCLRSRPLTRSSRRLRADRQRRRMAPRDRIAGGLGRAYRLPRRPVSPPARGGGPTDRLPRRWRLRGRDGVLPRHHDDRTPSMVLHLDTDRYHCFGCGAQPAMLSSGCATSTASGSPTRCGCSTSPDRCPPRQARTAAPRWDRVTGRTCEPTPRTCPAPPPTGF